jgi:hypothetical protein
MTNLTAVPMTNPTEAAVLSMPEPTVEQLQAELAALKAKMAEQPVVAAMTLEDAQTLVASFEGKRGRRPADFYVAERIIRKSTSKEDKAAAKAAAKAAKLEAKAAKVTKAEERTRERAIAKAVKASNTAQKLADAAGKAVAAATKRATKLALRAAELAEKAVELAGPVAE